jgi:dTDP-4-dehydrorhamnose 3,5-epimerase
MRLVGEPLPGVKLIQPQVFGDARGWFFESFNIEKLRALDIHFPAAQANFSQSAKGVLRGLHFQWPMPQAKLVMVLQGEVLDVAVDIRAGSATFGGVVAERLSAENRLAMHIPAGFAHGFQVLSETALFAYYCSDVYQPAYDQVVRYDDPRFQVPWVDLGMPPVLSAKDADAPPRRHQIPEGRLP